MVIKTTYVDDGRFRPGFRVTARGHAGIESTVISPARFLLDTRLALARRRVERRLKARARRLTREGVVTR
jgi:hypothetical protein